MAQQPKAKPPAGPGRGNKTRVADKPEFSENPDDQPITLAAAGIDKNLANRARKAAKLTEKQFEERVAEKGEC